jgi:hypothetical protein
MVLRTPHRPNGMIFSCSFRGSSISSAHSSPSSRLRLPACASTIDHMPLSPGCRLVMLHSPPNGEYKMHIFESLVDSPKSRLAILETGWDGAPTGQSLLSVTPIAIHEKSSVGHSKMEHFACMIQSRIRFMFTEMMYKSCFELRFVQVDCIVC